MENKYTTTETTMSLINYHFVFCPRYRRKIFEIEGVTERFKEMVREICEEEAITVKSIECSENYAYIVVSSPPTLSPYTIMRLIKKDTNIKIRKEFEPLANMPSVWTKNFFVSTEDKVNKEMISYYVHSQRTRTN